MEQNEQTVFKCKNCGELLDLQKEKDGFVKCDVCDAYNSVPKKEEGSALVKFITDLLNKLINKIKAILKL